MVLSDKRVASLYSSALLNFMQEGGCSAFLITIEEGERAKNRKIKEKIEDKMFARQCGHDTCLIAMGGGVVTDLGGFVAATYCRGIPYITIPTSLLGMVDAAIGSKTGLNVKYGKNLIGAIYSPHSTFVDPSMLNTLTTKEMRNGVAEIIKYGLILYSPLFYDIANNLDKWQQRDSTFLDKIITTSCILKQTVVKSHVKRPEIRNILNFGHTVGHAIETVEAYLIPHGEALAIGMVIEALISHRMGYIQRQDFDLVYHLIQSMDFPLVLSKRVTVDGMIHTMALDKKAQRGHPRFVILHSIGKVCSYKGSYCIAIDKNLLREVLEWMIKEFV